MKRFCLGLLLGALSTAPATASDPLSALRSLVGTWDCSYQAGKTIAKYKAVFAYDLGGNWLLERDTWAGGGDMGMITYQPKSRTWSEIVVEHDRTTTLFRATGDNPNYVVYRSVYPDASMTDIFDRTSSTTFELHFTQTTGGTTVKSIDRCVKALPTPSMR